MNGIDRKKLLKKIRAKGVLVESLLFLILCLVIIGQNDDGVNVTIEIHAPTTDDSATIYVTGNNPQMGNWQPDKVLLQNIGNHLWRKSFRFEKGTVLEYKVTQGSFDNEAADDKGRPFQNSVLAVNNDTTARTSDQGHFSG